MLLNYFKIAFRALLKFKGYTFINVIGLALGLTAGILVMIYVLDELSYDQFHAKSDRIYRVNTKFFQGDNAGALDGGMDTNAWPVGSVLRKDYPEIESVLYTRNASILLINFEDRKIKQNIHYASPEFFDIFSFQLIKGNPQKALENPFTIVISEDMEKKYFKDGDALNKQLTLRDTLQFMVTGVMRNIPSNSHIQADMLISFATYEVLDPYFNYDGNYGGWGNINMRNYVLLKEGVDVKAFSEKAKSIYMDHVSDMLKNWGTSAYVTFSPLKGLYLTAKSNGMGSVGSIERVQLVSGIAAFVILLACINFINLTTARSVYRAKEVGLRKVVGSTRKGLMTQFLSESFLLTSISLIVSLALVGLLLPMFNQLLGKNYFILSLVNPSVIMGISILVLVVSLLSGYYPALIISGLQPAEGTQGKDAKQYPGYSA